MAGGQQIHRAWAEVDFLSFKTNMCVFVAPLHMEGMSCSLRWSQKEDVTFLEYQLTPRGDTLLTLSGTIDGPQVIYSSTAKKW